MPALKKHAVFTLIITGTATLIFLAALPFHGPMKASAAFALLAFWALSGIFYRNRSQNGEAESVYDERDRQIQQRANTITFGFLWVIFVLACMGAWWFYGDSGKIPTNFLPVAVNLACTILLATWSISILWQYHRQG